MRNKVLRIVLEGNIYKNCVMTCYRNHCKWLTEIKAVRSFRKSQTYVGLLVCVLDTDNEITR